MNVSDLDDIPREKGFKKSDDDTYRVIITPNLRKILIYKN